MTIQSATLATVLALSLGSASLARPSLDEAAVRAFVARQEAAWNARDVQAFAATFTPDAVFVDQSAKPGGGVVPNGQSTRAQAMAQARRFFSHARSVEAMTVDSVIPAPDGRSAHVLAHGASRVEADGRPVRTLCLQREQAIEIVGGRMLSHGQVDTDVRCPR